MGKSKDDYGPKEDDDDDYGDERGALKEMLEEAIEAKDAGAMMRCIEAIVRCEYDKMGDGGSHNPGNHGDY